jgi:vitamin B12 transporter
VRYSALLSLLLALPVSRAAAQAAGDTSRLAPVVVTASRTDAPQAVATTAATVLRADALRARGITTVAAALREVPGIALVQTSAPGSQTSVFFRGGEPDYVQVLIDGVTINEPGGTINFANLTLDNVERIEVIRGPASVLYGSDAVTGVIQIFTRQGSGAPRADLGLRVGQRGLLDVDGAIAGGGPRARYSLGAGQHASAGLYDLNNDLRNSDASGRLVLAPTSRSSVALTGRYVDARYEYPTEYYGAPLDRDSYSTERRLAAGIDAAYAVHPRVDARVVLGLSRLQNVSDDRADGPGDFPFRYDARSLRRSADARADIRIVGGSTLSIGGDFDWQETETNSDDPDALPLLERWSRAGYTQLLGNLGGRVTYSVGGRLEENERFGSLGSLRGGLGVLVTTTTTLRAAGGSAFKEPQFPEITGGCCAIANRTLGPERSTGWEVGIEQQIIGDAVSIGATYFDQRFRDLIVYVPASGSTTDYQYQNAQTATSRGWELEARAGRAGGPSVRASLTGLDAVARATSTSPEKPLPRRPSHTGALVVASPIGQRLTVIGDATYVGRRHDVRFFPDAPFQQAERLPGYTLVGLAASLNAGRITAASDVQLTARVDNLLDEKYEAVAGFETPGRMASIGVRFRIGR